MDRVFCELHCNSRPNQCKAFAPTTDARCRNEGHYAGRLCEVHSDEVPKCQGIADTTGMRCRRVAEDPGMRFCELHQLDRTRQCRGFASTMGRRCRNEGRYDGLCQLHSNRFRKCQAIARSTNMQCRNLPVQGDYCEYHQAWGRATRWFS
ncbi:hypothetical protein BC939DRAFT_152572 [Gamsiella multidivaricata]|uniref:uncharacterized protein n=1 Tax=Gamsiella multidivaricata TaxID=101098 RepID=UPI00221E8EFB|nr:uncharacterized protein BC939DRAFT_152572 [Gamsiella multidivaricata]KAI7824067.1 hypothetical protein BC939DRAFT_152572 [Gamsiella multidivaricata]